MESIVNSVKTGLFPYEKPFYVPKEETKAPTSAAVPEINDKVTNSINSLKKDFKVSKENISLFGSPEKTTDFKSADIRTQMQESLEALSHSDEDLSCMEIFKIGFDSLPDEQQGLIIQHLKDFKDVTSKIEGLEKLEKLIEKVSMGYSLTYDDSEEVSVMSKVVQQKLNDPSLSPADKNTLKLLSYQLNNVVRFKESLDSSLDSYKDGVKEIKQNSEVIIKELDKIQKSLKEKGLSLEIVDSLNEKRIAAGVSVEDLNNFKEGKLSLPESKKMLEKFAAVGVNTDTVKKLMSNYQEILMAGLLKNTLAKFEEASQQTNKPVFGISLYSIYMEKFTDYLAASEYKDDPKGLYALMKEYDSVVEKINTIEADKSLGLEAKKEQIMALANNYAGNDTKNKENITILLEQYFNELSGNIVFSLDPLGTGKDAKTGLGIIKGSSQDELEVAKTASKETFSFVKENPAMTDNFQKLKKSYSALSNHTSNNLNAMQKFNTSLKAVGNTIKNNGVNDLLKYGIQQDRNIALKELMALQAKLQGFYLDSLNEIMMATKSLQSNPEISSDILAERFLQGVNSITEKFSALNKEAKEEIKKNLESQLADKSFMAKTEQNKVMAEVLDKRWETIKELLKNSKEVSESHLPSQVKELKYTDNLLKASLIALFNIRG